ncbi:MAG: hypothetical protein ACREJU_19765 [Nitrospiraceae bacterium]
MRMLHRLIWICLTLMITGCSMVQPKETLYLQAAQDRAGQEEVKQQLGPPKTTSTSPSGESRWVYQLWTWQPGDWRVTVPGTWCDEYVLHFDPQTILRRWTHNTYFHGGEAFPEYCIPARAYSSESPDMQNP